MPTSVLLTMVAVNKLARTLLDLTSVAVMMAIHWQMIKGPAQVSTVWIYTGTKYFVQCTLKCILLSSQAKCSVLG